MTLKSNKSFCNKSTSNLVCVCLILISIVVNFNVGSAEEEETLGKDKSRPPMGRSISNLLKHGVKNIITKTQRKTQTRNVLNRFLNHPFYNKSTRVAVFLNRPDEIKTRKLISIMLKSGRKVFLPWYSGNSTMKLLQMRSIYDIKRYTQENEQGILQYTDPKNRTEAMESGGLDLVIVPGKAFSMDGRRLGRGSGLYAKYLKELKKISPHVKTMGLAYRCQLVYDFPSFTNCVVVDHVVHPYKVYNPAAQIIDPKDPFGNNTHFNRYLRVKPRNSSFPKNKTNKKYKKRKRSKKGTTTTTTTTTTVITTTITTNTSSTS